MWFGFFRVIYQTVFKVAVPYFTVLTSKDFRKYSKNNPFMEHCGKMSRCIVCVKNFDGRRGAQSHSSKIHHMTLDGRILDRDKKEKLQLDVNKNLDFKEITPTENVSNENEKYAKDMIHADNMINLNLKINQLEKMGLTTQAYEIRKKYNLLKTKTDEKPADIGIKNMLFLMLTSEDDPIRKDMMLKLLTMIYVGASDDLIKMGLMKLMTIQKPEKSEFEKQVESLFVKQSIKNMNYDPIDDLIRYRMATSKSSDFVDGLPLHLKKIKESNTKSSDVLPTPATRLVLPSTKMAFPVLITHNRKIPSIRQVFPMGETNFPTNSHNLYFEFDESAHNDDLNMTSNFATPLDYADMTTLDSISN